MPSQGELFLAERLLCDFAERIAPYRADKLALHLRLSRLQPHRRQLQHLRIAADGFEMQIKPCGGQLFVLASGDIVYVTESGELPTVQTAAQRLRGMFGDDPLLDFASESSADEDPFCSWYHLAEAYDDFVDLCRSIWRQSERSRSLILQEQALRDAGPALRPVDPAVLGELERTIAQADLGNLIRSQLACTLLPGQPLQPVFREYFVAVSDLSDAIVPGTELAANRWLFQYLTGILDRRMLAHVGQEPEIRNSTQAFSLNMNVGTVLSPVFQKFDMALPTVSRGRLVIELQLIDIFADLNAYIFARDYLQERGYRVAIDGLTHLTLRYVDRARLGADLVKLNWMPDGLNMLDANAAQTVRAQIMETGQARTILCRCETEAALEIGQSCGIIMFQGRYIERLYQYQRDRAGLNIENQARPVIVARR